jgi:UDP-N-acetylglucosamine 2-epimerase (non-hydrolysing)
MKIILVAGARPNFMKIAPLMDAMAQPSRLSPLLVHTGQHYDRQMSELFFDQLGIRRPDANLGVGGGSQAVQTAEIMKAFEPIVLEHRPRAVLVVGDVNSTIACGLVAVKLGVILVHVEAGLRSGDRTMPEEINRVLTDAISDLLFCTEPAAVDNLRREGVADRRVHLVGNVMIDTLLRHRQAASRSRILDELGLKAGQYAVLTLHRPANVDDPAVLARLLDAVDAVQRDMPVVFPVHPRTRKNLQAGGLADRLDRMTGMRLVEPLGYLDFLRLMSDARLVLTDSGGIQEETTILKVPCLTLRQSTERPITAEIGSNQIVGTDPQRIIQAYRQVMANGAGTCGTPPLWDGQAAVRIVEILNREL